MVTFISDSPEATIRCGESWALRARVGSVFALRGELGAGKTQWVKGFALGLGFPGRVLSPTFGLVNVYSNGRCPLFHLDLYRLRSEEEIVGAGLDEFLFAPPGIAVVEWPERWLGPDSKGALPPVWFQIFFEQTGENERRISHEVFES